MKKSSANSSSGVDSKNDNVILERSTQGTGLETPSYQITKDRIMAVLKRAKKAPPKSFPQNLSVRALAGTGKTTTMVWGIAGVPEEVTLSTEQKAIIKEVQRSKTKSVRVTAFSKAIATEMQSRLPEFAEASTNHSLGLQTIKMNIDGRIQVDAYKNGKLFEKVYGPYDKAENKKLWYSLRNEVDNIVGISKMTLTGSNVKGEWIATPEEMAKTASFYSIESSPASLDIAAEVLRRGSTEFNWIDFDDMVFLPAAHSYLPEKVELGIVDEAQDMNKAQQWLALNSAHRVVTIGDIHQSIFGFAGADPTAIPTMESSMDESNGLAILPLNETRRCGKAIVEEAQKYVPEYRAHPKNSEGIVRDLKEAKLVGELQDDFNEKTNLMVLCRTNAPLTRLALQLLKLRVPVHIKGKKFGQQIIALIKKINTSGSVPSLIAELETYETAEHEKLMSSKRQDREDKLIELADRCMVIRIFCEGKSQVSEVIQAFEDLFTDDNKKNSIPLSSAHRAKGLEADKVFIYHPELLPHPKISSKSEFNKTQERNLAYVALTRAKHELVYCIAPPKNEFEEAFDV